MSIFSRDIRPLAAAAFGLLPSWKSDTKRGVVQRASFDFILASDSHDDATRSVLTRPLQESIKAIIQDVPDNTRVLVLTPAPSEHGAGSASNAASDGLTLEDSLPGINCARVIRRKSLKSDSPGEQQSTVTICEGSYERFSALDTGRRSLSVKLTGRLSASSVTAFSYGQLLLLASVTPAKTVPGGGLLHATALSAAGNPKVTVVTGPQSADAVFNSRSVGSRLMGGDVDVPPASAAGAPTAGPTHVTVVGSGWAALETVGALLSRPLPASGIISLLSPHPVPLAEDAPRYLGEVLARRLKALGAGNGRGGRGRTEAAAPEYLPPRGAWVTPRIEFRNFTLVQYAHGDMSSLLPTSGAQRTHAQAENPLASSRGDAPGAVPDAAAPAATVLSSSAPIESSDDDAPPPPPPPSMQVLPPPLTVYTAATFDALQTSRFGTDAMLLAPRGGSLSRASSGADVGGGKTLTSTQASPSDWPLVAGPTGVSSLLQGAGSSGAHVAKGAQLKRGYSGEQAGNGIELDAQNGGICVTAELAASADGVWAAGDGISWPDPLLGRTRLAPYGSVAGQGDSDSDSRLGVLEFAARVAAAASSANVDLSSHAAASAALAASNMIAAEAGRSAGRAGTRPLHRYTSMPTSFYRLPAPLSLSAVAIGACDPVSQASHGYFLHQIAHGSSPGLGAARPRAGQGGGLLADTSRGTSVVTGRDRTGIGAGCVFFVAPTAPPSTAAPQVDQIWDPSQPGGGLLPGSTASFRVTGALLWDARKLGTNTPLLGPSTLDARADAPATAKAVTLIHRLIAATRAQPLRGGTEGAALALEAAAKAVLSVAMPEHAQRTRSVRIMDEHGTTAAVPDASTALGVSSQIGGVAGSRLQLVHVPAAPQASVASAAFASGPGGRGFGGRSGW